MGPRWHLAVTALLGLIAPSSGSAEAALENDGKSPASLASTLPCWQTEDFVVMQKCTPCSSFEVVRHIMDPILSKFPVLMQLCQQGVHCILWGRQSRRPPQGRHEIKIKKTKPECGATGYIEQINCSASNKVKSKSCRSAEMEAHIFWKFEGAMLSVAVVFALMVVCRQRMLDRKALEKVRKQIESI